MTIKFNFNNGGSSKLEDVEVRSDAALSKNVFDLSQSYIDVQNGLETIATITQENKI